VSPAGPGLAFSHFRILNDTVGYSASAILAQGFGLAAGFLIARWLGPSDFGIWNAASLVLAYGAYVDFGVLSAMGRDLPFQVGAGNAERANLLEGAARWATLAGAVLAAVVVIGMSFLPAFSTQPPLMLTALRIMPVVLIFQQVYAYHRTVLRAHNLFGELSRQQVLSSVLTAGLAVLGVIVMGLLGRMLGALIAQGAIVAYALWRTPWRRLPVPRLSTLWLLMRIGIPITAAGSILSVVTTIDRPMVLGFLGEQQLGYFGLALLLTSMVSLIPGVAMQVLYPRITHQFGQSGRSIAALRTFVLRPPLVLACLLPLVIGPVYLFLPVLVTLFLPAYAPGLMAMRIVIVGIFFYSILGLTDYFLVTTGQIRVYAIFGSTALALNVLFDYVALQLGYGINGVAVAGTPLTYFIYSSMVIGYALSHYTRNIGDWCRYFSKLWLPFAYMVALLWMLEIAARRWVPSSTRTGLMVAAGTEVALYSLGVLPLAFFAAHELKLELSWASLARLRSGR
jgi:O-antigen/teichoic acid export membrane protein